jgi:glucose/arabinose dehydrogenase
VVHHGVLAEWTVDVRNANRVDPVSRREVLRIAHPRRDHVMGLVAFNTNAREKDADYGMLYIGVGDGGNTVIGGKQVDAMRNAQDKSKPLGKILRINPLAAAGRKYSVPQDNPFVRDPDALKEIWAIGLRNPQRFTWDTEGDGRMIIVDIGQANVEEINVGKAGANYGWGEREGTFVVDHDNQSRLLSLPAGDAGRGYTYPAVQYGHDLGRAVAGGFVYRGKLLPVLLGQYFFGDIVSGRVFFVDAAALTSSEPSGFRELPLHHYGREKSLLDILDGKKRADLRFGMDQTGEIYLLTKQDGVVRKLSALAPSDRTIKHAGIVSNPSTPR